MAAERQLSSSVKRSSDNDIEFACSPCSDEGKDTEAVNYCVDCQSYFCKACVRDHNKFKAMKEHKILDQTAMKSGTIGHVLTQQPATADNCTDHPGNTIHMYCGEHDVVCCTVCVAVDHRCCNAVDLLSKVAKGIMKSSDRQKTETSLKLVRKELEAIKAKKIKELSNLDCTLEDVLKAIRSLKKRILERVDALEKESVKEIRAKHEDIAGELKFDIETVDAMLTTTDKQIDNINKTTNDNESKLFVHLKSGEKLDASYKRYIEEVKHLDADTVSYQMNATFEKVLNEAQSFITIDVGNHSNKCTASLDTKFNVKVNGDRATCCVHDVCQLDDDAFVITDFNNNKLKRLDTAFKVSNVCEIAGQPLGICKITGNEVAVTLWESKKVQFVSVHQSMSPTRSFEVDVKCKGIQYNENQLIISCYLEGIRVYDLSGNIMYKYENERDGKTLFNDPCMIKTDLDGSIIRVAAFYIGLVTLKREGQKESVTTDPVLEGAFGVCEGNHGQIFVSGYKSNNIIQLDKYGTVVHEILSSSDGITSPLAVVYLQNTKRLLITARDSDEIKVFKLS